MPTGIAVIDDFFNDVEGTIKFLQYRGVHLTSYHTFNVESLMRCQDLLLTLMNKHQLPAPTAIHFAENSLSDLEVEWQLSCNVGLTLCIYYYANINKTAYTLELHTGIDEHMLPLDEDVDEAASVITPLWRTLRDVFKYGDNDELPTKKTRCID